MTTIKVVKTCTKCGETKPLDDFFHSAASRDGRKPRCRVCSRTCTPLENRAPAVQDRMKLASLGLKRCAGCKSALAPSQFWGNSKHLDGLASRCKDCARAWDIARNPERYRENELLKGSGVKRCSGCKTVQSLSAFGPERWTRAAPDAVKSKCVPCLRACHREYQRASYAKNPRRIIGWNKAWAARNPEKTKAGAAAWRAAHQEIVRRLGRETAARSCKGALPRYIRSLLCMQYGITQQEAKKFPQHFIELYASHLKLKRLIREKKK
jgi:hypothetical protein